MKPSGSNFLRREPRSPLLTILFTALAAFSLLGVDPFRLASGWFHRIRANLIDAARSPYLFDPPPNWPLGRQGNEVCALLFQHVIPGLRRNFALAKKL